MDTMTKRQAVAEVRALADAVIEQLERFEAGWDKGLFRDDDMTCRVPARLALRRNAEAAERIAREYA